MIITNTGKKKKKKEEEEEEEKLHFSNYKTFAIICWRYQL